MTLSSKEITMPWFLGCIFTLITTMFTAYSAVDGRLDQIEKVQIANTQKNIEQDKQIMDEKEARSETNKKLDTIITMITEIKVDVAKKEDKK